jgi:predicted O-methyltransferase YrrM
MAGVLQRLRRGARPGPADQDAVGLAVAEVMRRHAPEQLSDPARYAAFLGSCFGPLAFEVRELKREDSPGDSPGLCFRTLIDHVQAGVFPLAAADAARIGAIADGLLADRRPFDRDTWAGDVGLHADAASSFARKGRLLAEIVRIMRVDTALELGTAYGLSSLFIDTALPDSGRLVTVERSQPQYDVAGEVFGRSGSGRIEQAGGATSWVLPDLAKNLSAADFLFHDAAHSGEAYVEDFTAAEPMLGPGAVVLYDDIRWTDPRLGGDAGTYAGWKQLTAHARVRAAAELDREFGLLLLA